MYTNTTPFTCNTEDEYLDKIRCIAARETQVYTASQSIFAGCSNGKTAKSTM